MGYIKFQDEECRMIRPLFLIKRSATGLYIIPLLVSMAVNKGSLWSFVRLSTVAAHKLW
jgi:hypothetical protein